MNLLEKIGFENKGDGFFELSSKNLTKEKTMNIGEKMKMFNQYLFNMNVEELNLTKDLIEDIIQSKLKSTLRVGMKVNVVQKTKKTLGVITKIMQSKCLVDLSGRIYRVPMSMLEVA